MYYLCVVSRQVARFLKGKNPQCPKSWNFDFKPRKKMKIFRGEFKLYPIPNVSQNLVRNT
jgi:hypothetical protein